MNHTDHRPGEETVVVPDRTDATLLFIGRIVTPWPDRRDCPRQGDRENGPACLVEVDPQWRSALDGVNAGMHLQVLYWLHLARRDLVRQLPRGRPEPIGTFALRSPMRPNPIGSSSVIVVQRDGLTLQVRGLDCVSGTPLLDLKPDRCPMAP